MEEGAYEHQALLPWRVFSDGPERSSAWQVRKFPFFGSFAFGSYLLVVMMFSPGTL